MQKLKSFSLNISIQNFVNIDLHFYVLYFKIYGNINIVAF